MNILMLVVLLVTTISMQCSAQQLTWELRLGDRTLLNGTDTGKTDTLELDLSAFTLHQGITLRFREKPSRLSWRYVLVCADNNGLIMQAQTCSPGSDSCFLPSADLRTIGQRSQLIRLFLEQHPADPGSSIRSRRTSLGVLHIRIQT